jgi:hypothetical protein
MNGQACRGAEREIDIGRLSSRRASRGYPLDGNTQCSGLSTGLIQCPGLNTNMLSVPIPATRYPSTVGHAKPTPEPLQCGSKGFQDSHLQSKGSFGKVFRRAAAAIDRSQRASARR